MKEQSEQSKKVEKREIRQELRMQGSQGSEGNCKRGNLTICTTIIHPNKSTDMTTHED